MNCGVSRRQFISAAVVAGSLSAGCVGRTINPSKPPGDGRWPTYKFNAARTSHVPDGTGPTDGGEIVWAVDMDGRQFTSPILADGSIYVGGSGTERGLIHSFTAKTGEHRWTESFSAWIQAAPTASPNSLYIADSKGIVRELGWDGEQKWEFDTGTEIHSAITVQSGTVYLGGIDFSSPGDRCDSIVMIDAVESGKNDREWRYDYNDGYVAAPAVGDGRVYVCSNGAYMLDTSDGGLVWDYETQNIAFNTPSVADGTVYTSGYDGTVHAVAAASGDRQWSVQLGSKTRSSPAVAHGNVVLGSNDGNVHALDANTGDERWRVETNGIVQSSPVIVDGTVYVGSDDRSIYAIDLSTGSIQWTTTVNSPITTALAVAGGVAYVVDQGGTLYAIAE